jgi:CRISPR-associated protein Cmr2
MPSTQYLFLFTIGPVQSFIAQARKTRDLYAGSAILGEIISAALKKTLEIGGKIIIPDSNLDAKPNRFLAQIVCEDDAEVKSICSNLETVVKEQWIELAIDSLRYAGVCSFDEHVKVKDFNAEFYRNLLENHESGLGLPSGYRKQICDFLEVYWVAVKRTESYTSDYNRLQMLLAGIKNARQFSQINEPPRRKCSLDGERNALFYRKREIEDLDSKPVFIQDDATPLGGEAKFKLLPGEGLSAVSLAKRFYKPKEVFPSTAAISLMHALREVAVRDDKNVLHECTKIFGRLFDEQLYYEENLTENYFKRNGIAVSILPKAIDNHNKIKNAFERSNVRFQKYYAIFAFDGDSMGEVWSGDLLSDKDDLSLFQEEMCSQLQQFQQVLAYRLGIYAAYASAYLNGEIRGSSDELNVNENKKLRSILEDDTYRKYHKTVTERRISAAGEVESVEQYKTRMSLLETPKGKTVYAGGDDFLGFVNLQYLFEVMKELREAYDALVSEPMKSNFGIQKSLSFSAGVAIAHYRIPLNEVLKKAHEMEKKAKEIDDEKDAFSIVVMKHAGTIEEAHFKWKINGERWMTDELSHIIHELCVQRFSNTFITALCREFVRLQDAQGNFCHQEFVRFEIHRLLKRANTLLPHDRETAVLFKQRKKQAIEKLENAVYSVYSEAFAYDPVSCMRVPDVYSFSTFLSALTICDFVKRKTIYEHN